MVVGGMAQEAQGSGGRGMLGVAGLLLPGVVVVSRVVALSWEWWWTTWRRSCS